METIFQKSTNIRAYNHVARCMNQGAQIFMNAIGCAVNFSHRHHRRLWVVARRRQPVQGLEPRPKDL